MDRIEFLAWAETRDEFIAAITTTYFPGTQIPLASVVKGLLIPTDGIRIDEIGPITKAPAIYADGHGPMSEDPQIVTPAEVVEGWHVNFYCYGWVADLLIDGLEQTDSEGNLLGLFERTRINALLPQLTSDPSTDGVPEGYIGPKGLKVFDPNIVNNRNRIWC